jgi:hypothetical protein
MNHSHLLHALEMQFALSFPFAFPLSMCLLCLLVLLLLLLPLLLLFSILELRLLLHGLKQRRRVVVEV